MVFSRHQPKIILQPLMNVCNTSAARSCSSREREWRFSITCSSNELMETVCHSHGEDAEAVDYLEMTRRFARRKASSVQSQNHTSIATSKELSYFQRMLYLRRVDMAE